MSPTKLRTNTKRERLGPPIKNEKGSGWEIPKPNPMSPPSAQPTPPLPTTNALTKLSPRLLLDEMPLFQRRMGVAASRQSYLANDFQVSITLSGLSEIELMP